MMMSDLCPCIEATRRKEKHKQKEKQKSQWEGLMKQFSEKHKEKCKSEELAAAPHTHSQHIRKKFMTGSSYEGEYEDMNMRGYGEYTFPNGVRYRGEFESGMCHGDGDLVYKFKSGMCQGNGDLVYTHGPEDFAVVRGKWVKGIMTEGRVLIDGVLEYKKDDWLYCKMPDRRYALELNKELKPAGKSNITPEQPPREIPAGFCDNGYGFYNHETGTVYKYDNLLEAAKATSEREQKWTADNCRQEPVGKIGPRQDMYETWLNPNVEPTPPPPVSKLRVGLLPNYSSVMFERDAFNEDEAVLYESTTGFKRPPPKFQSATK